MAGLSNDNVVEAKSLFEDSAAAESGTGDTEDGESSSMVSDSQGSQANNLMSVAVKDLQEKARTAYLQLKGEDMFEIMK